MKMFPKTQDHTIDKLLRAQGGGPGKALPLCREFDADLANAYVERSLTVAERAGYEQHLAACAPCRKSIVALTRMAQADSMPAHRAAAAGQTQSPSPVRQWLGALTMPQWAMAAAAAVVLAISLPLFLSHRATPSNETSAVTEDRPSAAASTASAPASASAPSGAAVASNAREVSAQERAAAEKPAATDERKEAQAQPAALAGGENGAATAGAQPAAPKPTDEVIAKVDAPAQPAGTTAAGAAPAKTSDDEGRAKAKEEAKDAAARPGSDKRAEAASEQAGNIAPPPPPPTRTAEPERGRRDEAPASGPAMSAFRATAEAVTAPRGPSRRVAGHQFWLRGNTWTDKDYDPDKDKPVTIIRDSEVYRDLLTKNSKLKTLLTDFPADARVIFKFKGTVYKLIPQDADR